MEAIMNARGTLPPITIAIDDFGRLAQLARTLASQSHPLASPLFRELLRAELCDPDDLPHDVVAMNRFVTYTMEGDDGPVRRALVHPNDTIRPAAELSILSPVGISLVGLRAGDRMSLLEDHDDGDAAERWVEVVAVGPSTRDGSRRKRAEKENLVPV
jgi:regulator of nucleoside diphosphate kinase